MAQSHTLLKDYGYMWQNIMDIHIVFAGDNANYIIFVLIIFTSMQLHIFFNFIY